MAERTTGQLANNLSSPDKVNFFHKIKRNSISVTSLLFKQEFYDTSGYFVVDSSSVDGPDILLDATSVFTGITPTTKIFNDRDTYRWIMTNDTDLATTDWTFNYATGQITTTVNDLISDYISNDSSAAWTTASLSITNPPTDFTSNYSVDIIHDGGTTTCDWDDSCTFASSTSLKFQVRNTGEVYSDRLFRLEQDGNNTDEEGLLTLTDTDITYSAGHLSQAADFNGTTSNQEQTGASLSLLSTNWSISFWMNKTSTNGTFFSLNNSTFGEMVKIYAQSTDLLVMTSSAFSAATFSSALTNSVWSHIVLTYDSGTLTLYVDGSSVSSTSYSILSKTINDIRIGKNASSADFFQGSIDQTLWYEKTLTASDVSSLYNSGSGFVFSGETLDMFGSLGQPPVIQIQYS